MIKKIFTILFLINSFFLFSQDTTENVDFLVGANGKKFYEKMIKEDFVVFRMVKTSRSNLFSENRLSAKIIRLLDTKEFVEIVETIPGSKLTKVRAYDPDKGYIEGYTKDAYFFNTEYFSEPFEMSEQEKERVRLLAEKRKQEELEREKQLLKQQRQKHFKNVMLESREDQRNVMGMSYQDIVRYMRGHYNEDSKYLATALKTVKFDKGNLSIYFTLEDKKITGFHFVDNKGMLEDNYQRLLYELCGEIYYTITHKESINSNIDKEFGTVDNISYPIVIKKDNTKKYPVIEITVGNFSGIE